jgi:hypothetical protein
MSKPLPICYRTTNWSNYTAVLRKRGSLLIWLDKGMTWLAPPDGKSGRLRCSVMRRSSSA